MQHERPGPRPRRLPDPGSGDRRLGGPRRPGALRREARAPLRHGRLPLRRARRGHQHHAPHPPGLRRGGDPPRPQPLGRGGRGGRRRGGRARHRHLLLPGRPHGVLPVREGPARGEGLRAHQGLRRRWRGDHPRGDRGAARVRRGSHLQPRGRPQARPPGHDRRDDAARGRGPAPRRGARRDLPRGGGGGPPSPRAAPHPGRDGGLRREPSARLAPRTTRGAARDAAGARDRRHRHGRRRQVVARRRDRAALPAGQHRRHRRRAEHRPVPPPDRGGAARRPHPHELAAAPAGYMRSFATRGARRARGRRTGRGEDLPGGRVRLGDRRDVGHRPGRHGDRRGLATCRST